MSRPVTDRPTGLDLNRARLLVMSFRAASPLIYSLLFWLSLDVRPSVLLVTRRYGDFVPYTLMGRIWVLAVILSGAFLVAQLVSSVLAALAAGRRGTGTFTKSTPRHVILCGNIKWEFFVQFVIELYAIPSVDEPMLVVLHTAPFGTEGDQGAAELWNGFVHSAAVPDRVRYKLVYLEGDATAADALHRARVGDASAVFVLCNQHSEDTVAEDSATLKRVLTIRALAPAVPVYAMVALRDSMLQISFALSPAAGRPPPRRGQAGRLRRQRRVRRGPPKRPRRRAVVGSAAVDNSRGDGPSASTTSASDVLRPLPAERVPSGTGGSSQTAFLPWSTAPSRKSLQSVGDVSSGMGGGGGSGSVSGADGDGGGEAWSSDGSMDQSTPLPSLPSSSPTSPSVSTHSSFSHWSSLSSRGSSSDSSGDERFTSFDSINVPDVAAADSAYPMPVPSAAQLSEAVCMQEVEMGLLAENVFCNGLSTLLCNLCQRVRPPADAQLPSTDAMWMHEYRLGSECHFGFCAVPDDLDGVAMADVAVVLYDLGIVLLAVRHEQRLGLSPPRWATVAPSTVFRRGDTAIAITYLEDAEVAEQFQVAASAHCAPMPSYSADDGSTTGSGSMLGPRLVPPEGPPWGAMHPATPGIRVAGEQSPDDDEDDFGGMSMERVAEEIVSLPSAIAALPQDALHRVGRASLLGQSAGGGDRGGGGGDGSAVSGIHQDADVGPMHADSDTGGSASTSSPSIVMAVTVDPSAVAAAPAPVQAPHVLASPLNPLREERERADAQPPQLPMLVPSVDSSSGGRAIDEARGRLSPFLNPVRVERGRADAQPPQLSTLVPSVDSTSRGGGLIDRVEGGLAAFVDPLPLDRGQADAQPPQLPMLVPSVGSSSGGGGVIDRVQGGLAPTLNPLPVGRGEADAQTPHLPVLAPSVDTSNGGGAVIDRDKLQRLRQQRWQGPSKWNRGSAANSSVTGSAAETATGMALVVERLDRRAPLASSFGLAADSSTSSRDTFGRPGSSSDVASASLNGDSGNGQDRVNTQLPAGHRQSSTSEGSNGSGWVPATAAGPPRGSSKAAMSAAAFAAAGGRNLILYGARPLPVRLRSHIVVCLLGAVAVGNLRAFLERIWQPRDGGRAPRTPVVAVSAAFTAADEAALSKYDKSPLFLVRGNSMAIPTLRRAQYGSAKAILILACEARPHQHASDSRALFTVMTLDHLLTTNSSVFVCCMLDAEASMALLRAPANPRRQGTTLGEHTEPAMTTRTPAVFSWARVPSGLPSPAASFVGSLPRTYSGLGYASASAPGVSSSSVASPGPYSGGGGGGYAYASRTPMPSGRDESDAYRHLAGGLSSASLFNSALYGGASSTWGGSQRNLRFDGAGIPVGGSGIGVGAYAGASGTLGADTLTVSAHAETRMRQRYASGEVLLSSALLALAVREAETPGLMAAVRTVFGVGLGTRARSTRCWIRALPVPRSWLYPGADSEWGGTDDDSSHGDDFGGSPSSRVYRDLFEALLPLGALPLGLYRAGDAVFRMRVTYDEPGGLGGERSSSGSQRGSSVDWTPASTAAHSRRGSASTLSPASHGGSGGESSNEAEPVLSSTDERGFRRLGRSGTSGGGGRSGRLGTAGAWSIDHHLEVMEAQLVREGGLGLGGHALGSDAAGGPADARDHLSGDEELPPLGYDEYDDEEELGEEIEDGDLEGAGGGAPLSYVCPTSGNVIYYQELPSPRDNRLPYVYTNPEPFTLLSPLDAVYVLVHPETHIPDRW